MRFNPDKFDRHLENIGQNVQWRRSYSCICLNPDSGAPNPRHARCGGKGRIWADPIDTKIGISRQDTNDNLAALGHWDSGDMLASIPRSSVMWAGSGMFDRVTMKNSTDIFSQPMQHGSPMERLIFAVKSISRVFWEDSSEQLVEGAIPVVADDGTLSWPGGIGEPPPASKYAITGEKYSEYYVYGHFPSDRNEHAGMELPKRCTLRKFDLFNR